MKKVFYCIVASLVGIILLAGCMVARGRRDVVFRHNVAPPPLGCVQVTFLGVTTLLIDDGYTQLLIDGFFSRPSLGATLFLRVATDTARVNEMLRHFAMNKVKAVFVTHSHYEHALDAAYVAKQTGAHLYGSVSTINIGRGGGLPECQMSEFQPNKNLSIGGFSVRVIPSKHSRASWYNNNIGRQITSPLCQPAKAKAYVEGHSFDFFITHAGHTLYIKPSANYEAGALDSLRAEVLFLGTGTLGKKSKACQKAYYTETVRRLRPQVVVPVHWDNFFRPFSKPLAIMPKPLDNTPATFRFLREWTKHDNIEFTPLQGGESTMLFEKNQKVQRTNKTPATQRKKLAQ